MPITDAGDNVKPFPRWVAYVFVFGGALGLAALVDLVRYLSHLDLRITTLWLLVIIFTGFALGGATFVLISKARASATPTPNNRWRGP